jgi:Trk-type K+ transport system membrane component
LSHCLFNPFFGILYRSLPSIPFIVSLLSSLELTTLRLIHADTGLPILHDLPIFPRITTALFQGLAARTSGFAMVNIALLAPAMQVLYVVLMWVAVSAGFGLLSDRPFSE